jgi:hypothetical protein
MGLIVTGMHRSGTSAVARVVEALGLTSGGPAMGPAPDNPRGFFERPDVMHVNDAWLASLGGSWWAPPHTSPGTWRHLDERRLASDREALGLFDPDRGPWYVKDPRVSLLMPLWDRFALQPLPVVLAVRDPREVASSLLLRNGMPPRRALAVWFAYVREALATSHDRPLLVLDYDALVSDPGPGLDALGQFAVEHAGAQAPLPTMDALLRLVEPSLRRNHVVGALGVAPSEVEEALDAYLRIAKAHADVTLAPEVPELPAWAQDVLDEAREAYAAEESAREATALIARLERELRQAADPAAEVLAREEELRLARAEQELLALRLTELETSLQAERVAHDASREEVVEAERALAEVVERAQERERERAVLEQELQRLRGLVADSEARMVKAAERAESLGRVADERVAETLDALRAARADERRAAEQVSAMRDALAAKESELVLAHARLAEVRDEAQRALASSEEARKSLSKEVAEARQARAVLESELARVKAELFGSAARITGLEADVAAARQDASERVTEAVERLGEVQGLLEERDRRVAELQVRLSVSEERTATLASRIGELQAARECDLAAISREAAQARAREDSHAEATAALTERLAVLMAERSRIAEVLDSMRGHVADTEAALQQVIVEREVLRDRATAIAQGLDQVQATNAELMAMGKDLRQRLALSEGRATEQTETNAGLTESLMKERGRAVKAERSLEEVRSESERLRIQLDEQAAMATRLAEALTRALGAGQDLATELDGIKASRSYRLRRRLSREAAGTPTEPHFIPGVEPSLVTEVIARGLFDPDWYSSQNADVESSGVDPTYHYFTQGWREGRLPSAAVAGLQLLASDEPGGGGIERLLGLLLASRPESGRLDGGSRE